MITVYMKDGKPFSDEMSTIILETKESFDPAEAVCGGCGRKGRLVYHSNYPRWLEILEGGVVKSEKILLDRYRCVICGKTHVVAPGELVIPYSRHSLGFILAVIDAYEKRVKPVRKIAEDFNIVVSTLYAWAKRFHGHYDLLAGKLSAAAADAAERAEAVLAMPGLPQRLHAFVETYGTCFLQALKSAGTTRFFTLRGHLAFCRGASP